MVYKSSNTSIRAIIWDYDGTLVDTQHKNLNVTRNIIEKISDTDVAEFSALQSLEKYHLANKKTSNWRELYRHEFNFSEEQIDAAGRLWTAYQLNDDTEVTFYEGIVEVIRDLSEFPQGIVSQNSKFSIIQNLEKTHLLPFFKCIVGYEEVDLKKQKPDPDGLLRCMGKVSKRESGYICYIGDHETDVQCAHRANCALQEGKATVRIISIGAYYDSGSNTGTWKIRPDYEAHNVKDILDIVARII